MTQKQCIQCSKTFTVDSWDVNFYKNWNVLNPKLCPDCRFQRRLTWRNSRNLYKRNCDLCKKEFIGMYSADKPYTVYCHDCYYSDNWDPLDFGKDFDFKRSFFEQFNELMLSVPHAGMNNQDCDNSSYVNVCWKTTNSYLCFGSDMCDECYYCTDAYNCRNTYNSYMSSNLEVSSYCVDCNSCYNTHYSQECDTVRDSYFCFDVRSSNNCFSSAGLRNKEYYIFNKPVPKNEWQEKVQKLLTEHTMDELYKMAEAAWNVVPRKASIIINAEDVSGDHIQDSAKAHHCFDIKEVTNVKYVTHSVPSTKDTMDADNTGAEAELMYEFIIGYGYNILCSSTCYNGVRDLSYCYETQSSHDCFGSIGLRKQSYVLFNKQYAEQEYADLVKKISAHMKETGEWGEFFPIKLSPFAYNETEAQIRFPLNNTTAEKNGFSWHETKEKVIDENIQTCNDCGANYKIIKQEQAFIDTQQLPQPDRCPDCRFMLLFKRRNPYTLWKRQCMCTQPDHAKHKGRCTTEFDTTYNPDRKEIVYCESCYQKEIY